MTFSTSEAFKKAVSSLVEESVRKHTSKTYATAVFNVPSNVEIVPNVYVPVEKTTNVLIGRKPGASEKFESSEENRTALFKAIKPAEVYINVVLKLCAGEM